MPLDANAWWGDDSTSGQHPSPKHGNQPDISRQRRQVTPRPAQRSPGQADDRHDRRQRDWPTAAGDVAPSRGTYFVTAHGNGDGRGPTAPRPRAAPAAYVTVTNNAISPVGGTSPARRGLETRLPDVASSGDRNTTATRISEPPRDNDGTSHQPDGRRAAPDVSVANVAEQPTTAVVDGPRSTRPRSLRHLGGRGVLFACARFQDDGAATSIAFVDWLNTAGSNASTWRVPWSAATVLRAAPPLSAVTAAQKVERDEPTKRDADEAHYP